MEHDYIALTKEYGTKTAAAKAIGIPRTTFKDRYRSQEQSQSLNKLGLNPQDAESAILDGLEVKGTSRYYKLEDGGMWVKTDQERVEAESNFKKILDSLIDDIPKVPPTEYTHVPSSNLCSTYIISDFHLGQYSSKKETGDEWTVDIAFDCIVKWFQKAVHQSPFSKQAVLVDLGDFLHADGLTPITPASGHILDASGRFRDVFDVAMKIFDQAIQILLEKHESVHVIICEGNHNESTSYLTTVAVSRRYEDEPRVTFDFSHAPYYAYEWGKTSLFFHHGHKKRIADVARTFAGMFRDVFGKTEKSYGHVGHMHHRDMKECSLMVMEQHSTLAAKDAYSARGGYLSERGASVINYHKDYGEVGRITIRPEMLS